MTIIHVPMQIIVPAYRDYGVTQAGDHACPSREGYPADVPRASDHQDRSPA